MQSMIHIAFGVVVAFLAGMPASWAQSTGHKMSPNGPAPLS
jgi:hypothetical protein